MKTRTFLHFSLVVILATLGLSLINVSCKKGKEIRSLTKMLSDEKKNIENFIAEKGFNVAEASKNQTTFDPETYYLFDNGLYMKVLDKGTTRPEAEKTHIIVRFKGYFFTDQQKGSFDNLSNAKFQNTEFLYIERYEYGSVHFQLMPAAPGSNINKLMCEGLAYPMSLLGDGARVSLIIPFLIGPETAYSGGLSMFCEEARYQFIVD